jgi:hypothetical protein
MPRHPRTRWLIAGLAIVALSSGGNFVSTAIRNQRASAADRNPLSTPAAAAGGDPRDRPRRNLDAGAAAEAKLRSLLEVREGEISCIHIPASLMAAFSPGPQGDGLVGAPTAPDLVGIISRAAVLEGFKGLRSSGETIEGNVDADAGEFVWSGKRLQVSGTAINRTDSVRLKLEARDGETVLECLTRVPPGGIVFLRSSDPDSDGILLVVGQRAAEETPAPKVAEP